MFIYVYYCIIYIAQHIFTLDYNCLIRNEVGHRPTLPFVIDLYIYFVYIYLLSNFDHQRIEHV